MISGATGHGMASRDKDALTPSIAKTKTSIHPARHMKMAAPRFSIRSLLIATTLIAVGLGVLALDGLHYFARWTIALALIGAGIRMPFNRALVGAAIGAGIPLTAYLIMQILKWAYGLNRKCSPRCQHTRTHLNTPYLGSSEGGPHGPFELFTFVADLGCAPSFVGFVVFLAILAVVWHFFFN